MDLGGWVQTTADEGQTCLAGRASFIRGREGRAEREKELRAASWEEKEREKVERGREPKRKMAGREGGRGRRERSRQSSAF